MLCCRTAVTARLEKFNSFFEDELGKRFAALVAGHGLDQQ